MELVWQLLPQSGQAISQPARAGNTQPPSPPVVDQAASTSWAEASLPPPSWPHSGDSAPGVSPGDHHQLLLPSHAGQHSALPHGKPLPAVPAALASPARQMATTDAQLQQPWPSLVSPGALALCQHPVYSRCLQPLACLWHRSQLPSEKDPVR